MEHTVQYDDETNKLGVDDLLSGNSTIGLFKYSQEEYDEFSKGFNVDSVRHMLESVARVITSSKPDADRLGDLIHYIQSLASADLDRFQSMVESFTETNPNMLWDMLNKSDKTLYSKPDLFYTWLSTQSDNDVDNYIIKAADGLKLHSDDMYKKTPGTKVNILDGYITISSSNLKALDKFRDRMLKVNDCSYEHRVKTHEGVEIHSYVFNMNNPDG